MTEYGQIVKDHFEKLRQLRDEKARIERDIAFTRQLLNAVMNLMPEEERGPILRELAQIINENSGLTQSIRSILQSGESFSAVEIKSALDAQGYDFTRYKSNPLSSIHAVLKRFKPSEVKTQSYLDGNMRYRWKKGAAKKLKSEN